MIKFMVQRETPVLALGHGRRLAMTNACTRLVARMVVAAMAGEHERMYELYAEYVKKSRLHVTVREILKAKEAAHEMPM